MDIEKVRKIAGIKLSEAKDEFEDSAEFTDEFFGTLEKVFEKINSRRWKNWMKMTDQNYPTHTVAALEDVKRALKKLEAEIEKAQ